MDAASADLSGYGRGEGDVRAPATAVARELHLDAVLDLARALHEGLARLSGPESQGHGVRLARALSLDIVELIQDARTH